MALSMNSSTTYKLINASKNPARRPEITVMNKCIYIQLNIYVSHSHINY